MPRERHPPEEIITKRHQVDVLISQGRPVADAVRAIGVTTLSYCRWRREFGYLQSDQVRKLKDLKAENAAFGRPLPI